MIFFLNFNRYSLQQLELPELIKVFVEDAIHYIIREQHHQNWRESHHQSIWFENLQTMQCIVAILAWEKLC
jgi:hypothetical protein